MVTICDHLLAWLPGLRGRNFELSASVAYPYPFRCTLRRVLHDDIIAGSPQQEIHTFALQPGVSVALVAILVDL